MVDVNEKEKVALQRFREQIGDLLSKLDSDSYGDHIFIKFLRARELNVDRAEDMFRKHIEWREKNDVKNVRTLKISPLLEEGIPVQVCGFDREGMPVGIMPFGRWKLRAAVDPDHGKSFVDYIKLIYQELTAFALAERKRGNMITQLDVICDFEGFSLTQIASRDVVESLLSVLKIMEGNYPESLKTCTVVNAPAVFQVLFTIVKPLLSFHTLSKVQIYGTNRETWRPVLHKIIDPEQLPSRFGGVKTTVLDYRMRFGYDVFPEYPVLPEEELQTVNVPAGDSYTVELPHVEAGAVLCWNFKTEHYNIGFYVTRDEDKIVFERVITDSHLLLQKGYFVPEKSGAYSLVFDNKHSKFRSKCLTYGVRVSAAPH